ncbi:MAG: hypothetical protein U9N45_01920, partial [Gemmatimonadota bacterium]|nr:hypothetical protein [Gemmatimonadota bacterium]
SLIIAYSHCIAHGINMTRGNDEQKKAVASGSWINYRYDPRRAAEGKNPLQLDTKDPTMSVKEYADGQVRFKSLTRSQPERAEMLMGLAEKHAKDRFRYYKQLAALEWDGNE